MDFQQKWLDINLSAFIKNTFICVSKMKVTQDWNDMKMRN